MGTIEFNETFWGSPAPHNAGSWAKDRGRPTLTSREGQRPENPGVGGSILSQAIQAGQRLTLHFRGRARKALAGCGRWCRAVVSRAVVSRVACCARIPLNGRNIAMTSAQRAGHAERTMERMKSSHRAVHAAAHVRYFVGGVDDCEDRTTVGAATCARLLGRRSRRSLSAGDYRYRLSGRQDPRLRPRRADAKGVRGAAGPVARRGSCDWCRRETCAAWANAPANRAQGARGCVSA